MKRHHCKPTLAGMAILLLLPLLLSGCKESKQQQAAGPTMPPPKVDVVTVTSAPFTSSVELPGRIAPVRVAEVRARVAGIVLSRNFEEGADVEKGQVLFQIDPAPFEAALAQAKASLAQAEASLFQAKAEYNRSEPLNKIGAISPQEFDAATAALKAAQAAKESALAQIKTAELNLGYATVVAPISGRIGRALVTEGALVGQGEATPMATVQQLDPIYADFSQPVADYQRLRAAYTNEDSAVTINLEEIGYSQSGRFLFSDVTVNRSTGQVSLRGEFPNPDGILLPNMFVRVKADLGTDENSIFVPQTAIIFTPEGTPMVITVAEDGTTSPRPVTTGTMTGGNWQILEGLASGESIVAKGVGKIRPGMKIPVSAKTQADKSLAMIAEEK